MEGISVKETAIALSGLSDSLSVEGAEAALVSAIEEINATPAVFEVAEQPSGREVGGVVASERSYFLGNGDPELFIPNTAGTVMDSQGLSIENSAVALTVLWGSAFSVEDARTALKSLSIEDERIIALGSVYEELTEGVMGEANRRSRLDPTWGQPKPSEVEKIEISQFVMMTHLAIEVDFDVDSFQAELLATGQWLEDADNLAKMQAFIDRMADS